MAALRWGILGTGAIARVFARDLVSSDTGRLVAVGSRDAERARAFGEGIIACGSYEELLATHDVDAVYIATPHPTHASWAIRAAEAGKHVLCEKPLTMNAGEAEQVVAAARLHGVFLMEAFMYRCHPQTAELVRLLDSGVAGEVRVIEAVHSFKGSNDASGRLLANELGGGGILDVGCYCVSGARLVAGCDPVEVSGAAHIGPTGVDEWAVASLKYPNGVIAHLSCGVSVHQPPVLRIHGTEGTLTLVTPWLPTVDGVMTTHIRVERPGRVTESASVSASKRLYAHQVDVVADCVERGLLEAPPPYPSWDDTLGNMRTLDAWRRAVGVTYTADTP